MKSKITIKANRRIGQLAKRINKLTIQSETIYSQEVDLIIVSDCRDKYRIERVLDGMLGFCFDKNMLKLYRKLCRYYYSIDSRATVEYIYAYRDMWDSG